MFMTHDIHTINDERLKKEFTRLAFAAIENNIEEGRFEVVDDIAQGMFTLDAYPEGIRALKYQSGATLAEWIDYLTNQYAGKVSQEQIDRIKEEGIEYALTVTISKLGKWPLQYKYYPKDLLEVGDRAWEEVKDTFDLFQNGLIYGQMKDDPSNDTQ